MIRKPPRKMDFRAHVAGDEKRCIKEKGNNTPMAGRKGGKIFATTDSKGGDSEKGTPSETGLKKNREIKKVSMVHKTSPKRKR